MTFGFPQPLEKPSAERIIREVPMEFEIPDYPQAQMQQTQEKPSMLPQILNAAAAFAGNPGAAQLLQTAATMLTPAPQPQPQVTQQPEQRRTVKPKPRYEEVDDGKPVRYAEQRPPQPKQPVEGVGDEWESEDNTSAGDFSFGLDGTHERIDPFAPKNDSMFADFESADNEMDFEIGNFGEEESFGDEEFFQDQGFPDLTGMSPEEMKQTVVDWVNADPVNRKDAVRAMLPDLASIIM